MQSKDTLYTWFYYKSLHLNHYLILVYIIVVMISLLVVLLSIVVIHCAAGDQNTVTDC